MTKLLRSIFGPPVVWLWLLAACASPPAGPALPLAFHTLRADDEMLRLSREAGAGAVIQVFSWRELEPTRRQYHWEVTDQVVAGAEYYGLELIVRLDQTPTWLDSAGSGLNAPPRQVNEYRTFAAAVAGRYRGRIKAYILWNEPNLAAEWGGQPPSPVEYVALLRAGYEGVKAGDPGALVVSAGLAPTNNQDDTAMDDRRYLQEMYAAGAAPYFDVLSAHPYGFGLPPQAGLDENDGLVFGRLPALRRIMEANGDGHKPVWITELGWSVGPPQPGLGGIVSEEEQARYLRAAFEQARREWPWVERFGVWNLARTEAADPFGGFSLLDEAGRPRPAYAALAELAAAGDIDPPPQPDVVPILAADVLIHLGDSDLPSPWWPLYGGRKPSLRWTGGFYLTEPPPPGTEATLIFEVMQSNELDNTVSINGRRLAPPLPQTDFTRTWFTVRRAVPAGWLQPGHNTVTFEVARLAPDLQHADFEWDDIQLRNVRLRLK